MIQKYVLADRFLICVQTGCMQAAQYLDEKEDEFSRLTIRFQRAEVGRPDMCFLYEDSKAMAISFRPETAEMHLCCPWEEIGDSTILPMMFRLMVEWLRQRAGEIKLHASAIERNGAASLILAPSEGGKTTTALAMCQHHGCLFRANDAAVVKMGKDAPVLLRGDTQFRVRFHGLKAYSPDDYARKAADGQSAELPWYSKLKLSPEEMGVETASSMTPIRSIFFVRLDTLVDGVRVTEFPAESTLRQKLWFKPMMMVLQNITGTIRGSDLIPQGSSGMLLPLVLPSLDDAALCEKRAVFLNELFSKCRVFQLRGQLEPMIDRMDQIMAQDA